MQWQDSGFLDLTIALQAALLTGPPIELSYEVALYAALLLHDERDPRETFDKLANVYDVRSKLVHRSRIAPGKRERTVNDRAWCPNDQRSRLSKSSVPV